MLVSAIITTHKRPPQIVERALKSVLGQTYNNMEIFVVDDSPSDYNLRDQVEKTVKKYQNSGVTYIPHEMCKGACAARNTGLSVANGEFIGFLDDDDEWLPTKIEKQLEGFTKPEIAMVYCASNTRFTHTGFEKPNIPPKYTGKVFDKLILENFIGSTSFPLIRTSALREIGGFDPEIPAAQDFDVWLRLAEKNEINYVDEVLVNYYFHDGDQITKNPDKKYRGYEIIDNKHKEYLKKHKKVKAIRYFKIATFYATSGRIFKAIFTWIKGIFLCPICGKIIFLTFKEIVASTLKK